MHRKLREIRQADASKVKKVFKSGRKAEKFGSELKKKSELQRKKDSERLEEMLSKDDPESASELATQKKNHFPNQVMNIIESAADNVPGGAILLKYILDKKREEEK